ncbi:MAG: hypothetical protein ACO1RT_11215 [Planctomycetaceae bacterium]
MTHFSPQNTVDTLAIQQSVTLIPCHTLEDFPSYLEDGDARSLLAAWTAPWHPALIAATGRLPGWNRADSIPEPLAGHLVFLPTPSASKLPTAFAAACEAANPCWIVRGSHREEFLKHCAAVLPAEILPEGALDREYQVADDSRTASADDFYALGYAWLQVQMMTRRLRYTSNLDEIFFASRVVEAARMMVAGEGAAAIAALHEAFDALAEERDHYFSTDPHLVDLTLLAPSTLGPSLVSALEKVNRPHEPAVNVLIDCDLAKTIGPSQEVGATALRELIDREVIGVAGGGLSSDYPVHHQTAASIRRIVADAKASTDRWLGHRCDVFARAAGPTPGDLAPILARHDYIGAIPIDFAAGEGWSSESKLNWSSSSSPLDVLVSKPIDGSRSDAFLSLAVRLGQAIDGGEIATALIVHWPGTESDAYRDLRRAASWGLALGRFWKIDEFFRDGQRPYHHYRGRADDGASQWLPAAIRAPGESPLATAAAKYRSLVTAEASQSVEALADLVNPVPPQSPTCASAPASAHEIASLDEHPPRFSPVDENFEDAAEDFCMRMSVTIAKPPGNDQSCLVINPHSSPTRIALRMDASPAPNKAVFGASVGVDGRYDVTVDVPAHGFVTLQPATTPAKKRWFASRRRIATHSMLVNEFMQVEISPESGGIKGVYSGSGRGNRYSLRLIHANDDGPADDRVTNMVSGSARVLRSDESLGIVETDGVLTNAASRAVADFALRYTLSRGSRWLWVEADIKPAPLTTLGENPWKSYFAFRSAVATEAATIFAPLRDKLHRTEGKRFDSPAGLLIDEPSRQTLLFTDGRPSHRQRGDRYLDSLLLAGNEPPRSLRFAIGFDVPSPIDALRSLFAPPAVITCCAPSATAESGWLLHCPTPDVVLSDLKTQSKSPLVISFLAIATRNESRKAKIRFCRDVVAAWREAPARKADDAAATSRQGFEAIAPTGDSIEVSLAGHEVVRVEVELATV